MARNLIVINVDFKETRVALIEDGVIAELQIERAAHRSTVGNIVLGRVTRVLPGMQAAFIDVGQERAAFLHVEDLIRPDDFDAYLAGDARDEQKPQVAGRQVEGPEADEEAEGPLEGDDDNGPEGEPAAARRGRRRRGRRGRGRPGAELDAPSPALPLTSVAALESSVAERTSDAPAHRLSEGREEAPLSSRYLTQPSPATGGDDVTGAVVDAAQLPQDAALGELSPPGVQTSPGSHEQEWGAQHPRSASFEHEARFEGRPPLGAEGAAHAASEAADTQVVGEMNQGSQPLDDDPHAGIDMDGLFAAGDHADDEELFAPHVHDADDDDDAGQDDDDDDDDELFVRDSDDDDDDDELFVRDDADDDDDEFVSEDDSDSDDDDFASDDDDDDDELFAVDDDDDEDELFPDDGDHDDEDLDEDLDDELFPGETDGDEPSVFVAERDSGTDGDDASRFESGPESGAFTEVDAVVLHADRPSYVNVSPAGDEDEPPSSGERETVALVDVVQPNVPAVARRSRQRTRREATDGSTVVPQVKGEEEAAALDTGADNRKRRGRRRRRRNGRVEPGPTEVVSERAEAPEAEALLDDSSPESDAGRRRRRRGRRRGRLDSKPEPAVESLSKNGARRMPARVSRSVPISEVVREGNLVVVQISKEPIGTKGARVTSHVSLPGRYVVYLPTVEHVGISKRIGNARERARLRKSIEAIKPAHGGLIVRTVAEGLTKKQLKADIGYLIKVWADVAKRRETAKPAEILYEELDLVLKAARDLFTDEVQQIVIDDRDQHGRLSRFVEMFMPGRVKDIKLYNGDEPIFDAYGIEDEIKRALSRKVPLPSGGSLVMDQAEALTAIDVNTGRYVGKGSKDLEETAFKTNLEAVDEIAYQLRFRNIGGLVILDLIDMEKAENRERVWRTLEQKLSKDKAKTTINRISELGLIEMTRKRTRESLGRVMHEPCFYCDGTGHIQSRETIAYEILRQIRRDRMSLTGYSVRVLAHPAVVDFLKHEARDALQQAERLYLRRIELVPRQEYHIEQYDLQGR